MGTQPSRVINEASKGGSRGGRKAICIKGNSAISSAISPLSHPHYPSVPTSDPDTCQECQDGTNTPSFQTTPEIESRRAEFRINLNLG